MITVEDLAELGESVAAPAASRDELAILYATIRDLTSTLSSEEVVSRLLDRVQEHLDSEIVSILLRDADDNLRLVHARGLPPEVVESTRVPLGEGISGHVAATGLGLLIEDIESHPLFRRRNHERYSTRSALSAPLVHDGRTIGVINVNNRRDRRAYDQSDLELVEAIAGHAAIALSNARRYEDTLLRAQNDPLTGLANNGQFRQQLAIELARARRHGRELGLVVLDVDRFGKINERHGHAAGDQSLMGVARVLRMNTRAHDLAARSGGEEFAVLLPETGAQGVAVYSEKVRASVSEARLGPGASRLTVSLGTAVFPRDGDDVDALLEAADRRLHAAKSGGRDRVCSEE